MAATLRRLVLLALLAVARPEARADDAQPAGEPRARSKLVVGGKAEMSLRKIGEQAVTAEITLSNPSEGPLEVRNGNLFAAGEGGWLTSLEALGGSFLGGLSIPAGQEKKVGTLTYHVFSPTRYAVVTIQAEDGHAEAVIPIEAKSGQPPPDYASPYPFGVGIAGPLEVVPYSDGQRSILLLGQFQCLCGGTPEKVETDVLVGDGSGSLDPIEWDGLKSSGDRSFLWPFVRRIDVPPSFTTGVLRLRTQGVVDGQPASWQGEWPVRVAEPVEMLGPVSGQCTLSNGPGQKDLHANYQAPENRYGYDIVVIEDGQTYRGDRYRNDAYFVWGKTVRAVADGTIVEACHREPDRQPHGSDVATMGSVRGAPCVVNHVVIEHDAGFYSVYLHLKRDSLRPGILPNQRVKAGDPIAAVGNSGPSTEPHLHFLAYRLDITGRPQAVPITFKNAWQDPVGKTRVTGVPVGGTSVYFLDRR